MATATLPSKPTVPTAPAVQAPVAVQPNTATVIPAAYRQLGATIGYNPPPVKAIRVLLVSREGCGKTTFLNSIPRTLVLDFEHSAEYVRHPISGRLHVESYEHLQSVYQLLQTDAKANNRAFDRVCFDSVDEMVEMYSVSLSQEKDVECIEEFGQKGAGHSLLRRRVLHDIEALYYAGYSWLVAGQLREKQISVRGKDLTVWRESMPPGLAAALRYKCDFFMTVNTLRQDTPIFKDQIIGGQKVRIQQGTETKVSFQLTTLSSEEINGKRRVVVDGLDIPERSGWQVFADAYTKATQALAKEVTIANQT